MDVDFGDIIAAAFRGAIVVGVIAAGVYLGFVWYDKKKALGS